MATKRSSAPVVARGRQLPVRAWALAAVAVVVLAGVFFAGLAVGRHNDDPVRVSGVFAGTVRLVSPANGNVCVMPDGGGAQRCSIALTRGAPVEVGSRVKVAVLTIEQGGSSSYEAFAIYPASP